MGGNYSEGDMDGWRNGNKMRVQKWDWAVRRPKNV